MPLRPGSSSSDTQEEPPRIVLPSLHQLLPPPDFRLQQYRQLRQQLTTEHANMGMPVKQAKNSAKDRYKQASDAAK